MANPQEPRFIVGIDLGTTHTVVAYADMTESSTAIESFAIAQLVDVGSIAERPLLPSARYHPAPDELPRAGLRLPWSAESEPAPLVGELARNLGAKSPGRMVASAKSWLSHGGVDRTAAILPWGAAEDVEKISPVEASSSYLSHVRGAWNAKFPDWPLESQQLVVTVPASFDEVARALTVEAARQAGLTRLRLLEEPQAACYAWLWRHRDALETALAGVGSILVVDVGGGTTDLTLIKVEPGLDGSAPTLSRFAVGQHLMLGGDNMDLALAHLAEQSLHDSTAKLSAAALSQLLEQCRRAKETLLASSNSPESWTVTLLGSGSRLIGASRSVELRRDAVVGTVLDGFFPVTELSEHPERKRSAVVEFGLPYAADPAISKHLAAFLCAHADRERDSTAWLPDAVLLNGGLFHSEPIRRRVIELLSSWRGESPKVLDNHQPDQAVAEGAVAYELARCGLTSTRIGGGSARSYFLQIETDSPGSARGICILPKGQDEDTEATLEGHQFALKLGRPVRFHLHYSIDERSEGAGDWALLDDDRFLPLPPLVAHLAADAAVNRNGEIPVHLATTLLGVGILRLQCVSIDDPSRRWDLEFDLRGDSASPLATVWRPPARWAEAVDWVAAVFGKKLKGDAGSVKRLRAELEKRLGKRDEWDAPLLRELFDVLVTGLPHRRRSAEHERIWFSLTGFCLRPGFGNPLDDRRIEQVVPLLDSGIQYVNELQSWAEWWTFWRRAAGGLDEHCQTRIEALVADFVNPTTAFRGNTMTVAKKRSLEDMIRLLAVLERLPAVRKAEIGGWLLARMNRPGELSEIAWALGRIGARVPLYGSAHNVVPVTDAEGWLDELLVADWKKEPNFALAAALIGRLSGDRARDVSESLRRRVAEKLRATKVPETWSRMVLQRCDLSDGDSRRFYGDSLPPGLRLLDAAGLPGGS